MILKFIGSWVILLGLIGLLYNFYCKIKVGIAKLSPNKQAAPVKAPVKPEPPARLKGILAEERSKRSAYDKYYNSWEGEPDHPLLDDPGYFDNTYFKGE